MSVSVSRLFKRCGPAGFGIALFSAASPCIAAEVLDFRGGADQRSETAFLVSHGRQNTGARQTPSPDQVPQGEMFPGSHVSTAMVADFQSGLARSLPVISPNALVLPSSAAISSGFVRVPTWMRTGTPASFQLTAVRPGIGSCAGATYRPSSLLKSSAEARRRALFPLVQRAACEAGLPVGLMDAMIIQESGYNPSAISVKGAFGLGQLMPGTARELGVDRYDTQQNVAGAARYLRQHLTEFGSASLALAAYNAGPGRVRRSRGVPNISETRDYVRSILRNWVVLENNQKVNAWQWQ